MKTEDLIRSYMKEHHRGLSDSEGNKKQVLAKPIKPEDRKAK